MTQIDDREEKYPRVYRAPELAPSDHFWSHRKCHDSPNTFLSPGQYYVVAAPGKVPRTHWERGYKTRQEALDDWAYEASYRSSLFLSEQQLIDDGYTLLR